MCEGNCGKRISIYSGRVVLSRGGTFVDKIVEAPGSSKRQGLCSALFYFAFASVLFKYLTNTNIVGIALAVSDIFLVVDWLYVGLFCVRITIGWL